jgi:hypothetical protein
MTSLYLTQKTSLACKYPVALVESGITPRKLAPTLMRDTNYSKDENVIQNYIGLKESAYPLRDRLCGLVIRVPGYRSRGPGSIPGATSFSEKKWVWNGVHSVS